MPYFITVKYQIIMFPFPTLELFIENFFLTTAPQPLEVLKVIKKVMLWVMSYELWVLMLTSCVYCMRYELLLIARVTSSLLYTSYEFLFIAWVTSYLLHTSYKLQVIARVTSYLLDTSHKLLFYCMSYELIFAYELWVTNYCMNFILHTS